MKISIENVSKRYINDWVFKNVNTTFEGAQIFAILGANGSGKSTLLRLIAGMQTLSHGKITYAFNNQIIPEEKIFNYISYCAPAMDIIEEMTLKEFLTFHFNFKKIIPGWTVEKIIEILNLKAEANKYISDFSSGMKQRAKLAQAFFTDTPFLLLDEPCSNLDLKGVAMYQNWLKTLTANRITIVASNDEREYEGAVNVLNIIDFK